MDNDPQAVQTGSDGHCRQCANPLPKRPSAKEHHFCNSKCRAAWHRGAKQRSLNAGLDKLQEARWLVLSSQSSQTIVLDVETVAVLLDQAYAQFRAAGAEQE